MCTISTTASEASHASALLKYEYELRHASSVTPHVHGLLIDGWTSGAPGLPPASTIREAALSGSSATGEVIAPQVLNAAAAERWDVVRTLLTADAGSHTLLQTDQRATRDLFGQAMALGSVRLLQELLSCGLHEQIEDSPRFLQRLVVSVVREGDPESLTALLQKCHQIPSAINHQDDGAFPETAPLLIAVEQDNERVIGVLLDYGADPNVAVSTPENWTALHTAAEWGNSTVMTRLIQAGANAEACSTEGDTPLHIAVRNNHIEAVSTLIRAGADVNARNSNGLMPLHIASIEGCTHIMTALLRHGALVNARDENGCTPLHLGAFFDENGARFATGAEDTQVAVVNLLLRNGADTEIRDAEGKTVLECAQRGRYAVIVALLIDHIQQREKKRQKHI